MKYYPEYKSSTIGSVPTNWELIRCGNLFQPKSIKNTNHEINLSVYRDYGVIKRDSRDDNHNRVSDDISNYKLVEPGDFVFNKMKCWQGSLGVSDYRGIVSPSYTVCQPKRNFYGKYMHHLLRSKRYIQEFARLSYGVRVGQWELRFHDFKDLVIPLPSLTEQTQIANFLDTKTKQIDKLIQNKEQKIKLLQEKRTAVINHAVTKGLNPDVEMKDSRVEWIGQIPVGWGLSKTKYLSSFSNGYSYRSQDWQDKENGIPVIRMSNISENGQLNLTEKNTKYISPELSAETRLFRINKEDVLISMTDMSSKMGLLGKTMIFPFEGEYYLNQRVGRIKIENKKILTKFYHYTANTDNVRNQLKQEVYPNVQFNLSSETIKSGIIPLPPLPEQQQIVSYLNTKTQHIDELISKEQRKIELLKEYRQSLISDAVTGKIDVREAV